MPPPPDYYLNYFVELLDAVESRYSDILRESDRAFIHLFREADTQAQRLLVRLLLRKGPLFLCDALVYPEIPNMPAAIEMLASLGLVTRNPPIRAVELIQLLPVAQSRPLFTPDRHCRKRDLLSGFENDTTEKSPSQWGCTQEIIRPAHGDALRRLNLLYFGNEHQSLTDFVLEDIGMLQFESVPLSPSNRLFATAEEVDLYLHLNDFRTEFSLMKETGQYQDLAQLGREVLKLQPGNLLKNRWDKVANSIAYRLEQQGELDIADDIFSMSALPPSRERRCRIAYKRGELEAALALLTAISNAPAAAEEIAFFRRFSGRVYRKLNLPPPQFPAPVITERRETWPRGNGTVEELACTHIPGAVWKENHLPLGIFGLIFWPVMFADVTGVWHHRFQSAPSDLADPGFVPRRQSLIDDTMQQPVDAWRNRMVRLWDEKRGIQNPFVHFDALSLEDLLGCFDAFTQHQWRGVFEHLLRDISHHRSGFPDLFVRDETGGRFIEVKGPGDRLRDNQIQWLKVFHQLGIHVEVCIVAYSD